jgi:hypothetical protein
MEKRMSWLVGALLALCVFMPGRASALEWTTVLDNLQTAPGKYDVEQVGKLYNAEYNFTVTTVAAGAPPSTYQGADIVSFNVESLIGNKDLAYNGTIDGLTDWAEDNAADLFKIFFGSSPESAISGETGSNLQATAAASRYMDAVHIVGNHDIRARVQYDFFKVGPEQNKAKGSSGIISYSQMMGETGTHAVGFEFIYRTLAVDDGWGTDMLYLMLSPYYEYSDTWGPNRWVVGGGLNGGLTKLNSNVFGGQGGYLQYGASIGGGIGRTLTRWLEARAALGYQYLERYIPDSLVSDDFKWLSEALNDMPAEQTLTPAVGFTVWMMPETLSLEGNLFRVHQVGGGVDSGSRYQTVANGFITWTPGTWRLMAGYKTSWEIENFKDHSIIASAQYLW